MSTALLPIERQELTSAASDFMPVFEIKQAIQRRNIIVEFTKEIMVDGVDYGKIPGTNEKTLLKPGAEKLATLFGLCPEFRIEQSIEDWTGTQHNEPLFYYRYKCRLLRNGRFLGESEGSCSSWESKYRYRWVSEEMARKRGYDLKTLQSQGGIISEFEFAIDKADTTGKYGKPAEYWQLFKDAIATGMARHIGKKIKSGEERDAWEIDSKVYRIPNPDCADQINTIQKMAQKRALIAATLVTTNASEFFKQDLEDMHRNEIEALIEPNRAQKPSAQQVPNPNQESAGKPWHTRGEMKKVFQSIAEEYGKRQMMTAYNLVLESNGCLNGDMSKFTPEKAIACYNELLDRLESALSIQSEPMSDDPANWPNHPDLEEMTTDLRRRI
jgi:hypothetical protein